MKNSIFIRKDNYMGKKITFEEFKERSNKIHKGKYQYDESSFGGTHRKTKITCPIHGDFEQIPKNHMQGQGCPTCGKEYAKQHSKGNYKQFLEKAKEMYGDSFEFPNIENEYVNNKTKITIKCCKCGHEFIRYPNDFLNKKSPQKCKKCQHEETIERRRIKLEKIKADKAKQPKKVRQPTITPEMYFKNFRDKFGDTIRPYMNEYTNTQNKIHFECKVCGHVFTRSPASCLKSTGCPKCNNINNQKLTNEEFKKRAALIHGNKYDYSKSEYEGTDKNVIVICHNKDEFGDEHGEFLVTPHAHIGSMHSGCPKCSKKYGSKDRFIKLSNIKYNNLYNYDNFVYNGAFKESYVTCSIHGDFLVSPNRHLNGQMCPKCIGSSMEKEISAMLDENGIEHEMRKHFNWLGKQELDIYLPKLNIAIECQGEQHFMPIKFYGGEEEFEKIKKLDELKKGLCEKNNVKLLYYSNIGIDYPYFVYENKEELLKEIVK